MRLYLGLVLLLLCFSGLSQKSKINLALKGTLNLMEAEEPIQLTVRANKDILNYAKENSYPCRYLTKSYYNIMLPASAVELFAEQDFIEHIDFHLSHPAALMDSSRVIHNIDPIHSGDSLPDSYTGDNVVIGIIDGHIEFRHDDFKDSLDNTRILWYWRQALSPNGQTPPQYGYGRVYDSTDINAGNVGTGGSYIDHGSTVAGAAAGNANANGYHKGIAPEAKIVHIASNFSSPNWKSTVADAIHYTFEIADSLNMPAVINASIGDYLGSHDGLDPTALYIDSLLNAQPGRLMVCAAGNSGAVPNYHLKHQNSGDTSFTWLFHNPSTALGTPGYFTEWWMDSTDAANQSFAVSSHDTANHEMRAISNFHFPVLEDGVILSDTLKNGSNILGIVTWYSEKRDGQYYTQIYLDSPDSSQHKLALISEGIGMADCWSASWLGLNDFDMDTAAAVNYAWMDKYVMPDSLTSIVDSWTCSPSVITVANFHGRISYLAYDTTWQSIPGQKGILSASSSKGPSRIGVQKPEITANGDMSMAAGSLGSLNFLANNQPWNLDYGGQHMKNGGTSMASPIVAGLAALLLEKCPKMTPDQFKLLLEQGATSDSYTGATPNYAWGYGKLNGWQSVFQSNFNLGINGDTLFCEGGMVSLDISPYDSIIWSNGQTGNSIIVDSSQWVVVEAWNEYGCYSKSDSLYITEYPNPPVPSIAMNADSIYTNLGYSYEWYLDGVAIPNSDSSAITPVQNGVYSVVISNEHCSNNSDTLLISWVGLNEDFKVSVDIYPNPTSGILQIQGSDAHKIDSWELLSLGGRLIMSGSEPASTISLKHLSKGIYFINIRMQDGQVTSRKIVLEKN